MQLLANFVILSFAVFGLTFILKETEGPWDIFFRLREFLTGVEEDEEIVYNKDGTRSHTVTSYVVDETGFFYKLYDCFWCISTWISIVVVGLYWIAEGYPIWTFPFVMLGTVGVSGFLYEILPNG